MLFLWEAFVVFSGAVAGLSLFGAFYFEDEEIKSGAFSVTIVCAAYAFLSLMVMPSWISELVLGIEPKDTNTDLVAKISVAMFTVTFLSFLVVSLLVPEKRAQKQKN